MFVVVFKDFGRKYHSHQSTYYSFKMFGCDSWYYLIEKVTQPAIDAVRKTSIGSPVRKVSSLSAANRFTLKDVAQHCTHDDCWIILYDKVYNITPFLDRHPAGVDILLENAGTDATWNFKSSGHRQDAIDMLKHYFIGILVEDERIYMPNDDKLIQESRSA